MESSIQNIAGKFFRSTPNNLSELWNTRQLIRALVGKHLNTRYRGSILGFLWSFLNPLMLIGIYTLVFRYYIRFDHLEHYELFLFAGMLPWIWFSSGLLEATSSIVSGGALITRAMFPFHVLPTVAIFTNLVNFLFAIPLLLLATLIAERLPGLELLWIVPIILIQTFLMLGLGYACTAINVFYRDVQHILNNLLTLLFFLCPIIYSVDVIPESFRFTLTLNPLCWIIQMYQQIFYYRQMPSLYLLAMSSMFALFCFIVGNAIFNYYRDEFAELV